MQRQQRTNYKRQTLSPSTPPEIADFKWLIESSSGTEIVLALTGPFGGHVFQGIPAFTRSDNPTLAYSAVLAIDDPEAGTAYLTLLYAAPLPASYTLSLPVADPALKGRHGGRLRASETVWTDPNPIPAPLVPSTITNDSITIAIEIVGAPPIVNGSSPTSIVNLNTTEVGTFQTYGGGVVYVDFTASGITNGDQIELAVEDTHITSPDGGKLQPFSYLAS